MAITEETVREILKNVIDPEIHMNIIDLGLVYGVDIETLENQKAKVNVKATLTTPACPYGPALLSKMHQEVGDMPGVSEVNVDLVWVPQWDPRTMASPEVKMKMGILEFEDVEDGEETEESKK